MVELTSISFGLALLGGIYDMLTRRIPNWLTFPGMLLGIAAQSYYLGFLGAGDAISGIAIGFALFFPIYALKYMGAGDVKLLMLVGAWGGLHFCLYTALLSIFLGGIYALIDVIAMGRLSIVFRATYRFLRSLALPGLVVERPELDKKRTFSFGIYIALAVALTIILQHSGRISV